MDQTTVTAQLATTDQVVAAGPFADRWSSLEDYRCPRWYKDAKFGIFIHWGVYSVPAFESEWYPRRMYRRGHEDFLHHRATWGEQSEFGYKDFIPLFKAERFDPSAWAELFEEAGARFVVPVAEHHDGFAMYESPLNPFNAAAMGPGRDVIAELSEAVRDRGMTFGVSSHRAEHYFFFGEGRGWDSDVDDEANAEFYGARLSIDDAAPEQHLREWLAQSCEMVDRFKPSIMWFDWRIHDREFAPYLKKFAAYYYNRAAEWGQEVAINYKNEAMPPGCGVFDIERGQLSATRPDFWQTDTSVSKNSWSHITHHDYKTVDSLISDLVDIVSKNGALLLNIGPKADGTIPDEEVAMLREIGAWLKVNGEAIYGTRPWKIFGEGPTDPGGGSFTDQDRPVFTERDIRFTATDDALYVIPLCRGGHGRVLIESFKDGPTVGDMDRLHGPLEIGQVELLGHGVVPFTRDHTGLEVTLPSREGSSRPFVLKVTAPDGRPING